MTTAAVAASSAKQIPNCSGNTAIQDFNGCRPPATTNLKSELRTPGLYGDFDGYSRGNAVSMNILFMVLGNRMGLKMALAEAPLQSFVKFTDSEGREWNLEARSGGALPVKTIKDSIASRACSVG
ncbi:MAG: hypothetical protein ABSB63_23020 [Spirochaetia bacterium]